MKESITHSKGRRARWPVLVALALVAVIGMALLATARTRSTLSITITNNSQREVRHLYLAPGDPDNWGPDQLAGTMIAPGASFTLNNISCDGSSLRVIAEDQNGCFLYRAVSCDANTTWTLTDSDTPDCGG